MAKVKNFKTIFPAVSVPLNEDYSINEKEFHISAGLNPFIIREFRALSATAIPERLLV